MKLFHLLVLTFLSLNLWAEIPQKNEIDEIFAEWDKPNVPGASLGIIQDGKLIYVQGYGMANLEYGIPNGAKSVFRIGSTSKQFTAACIVLLSQKGKLKLSDSLDQFFPGFPDYAKGITIQHLLNHTSGIRDYLTLAALKGFRDDDYYEDADVMQWLVSQQNISFKPGEEFLYSNSGYWLLGQIVNKVAEMNMAEFAEKEIFKPLGMSNTHFHNDHNRIVKNRASGYSPKGENTFEINMTTLNMIGDGGIFTTIEDVLLWDQAYYQSEVLNKEFWVLMTKQGKLNDSNTLDYASGLFIDRYKGLKIISHGGAFVGFRAELLRFPEQHMSVAIFANRGDANPSNMAFQVADIILQDKFIETSPVEPEISNKPESKDTIIYPLKQLTGNYQVAPGVILELTIKDETLHAHQSWNNKSYNLKRINENLYQIPDDSTISFTFTEPKNDLSQLLIVNQSGEDSDWKRKIAIDIPNINLNEYVGKFYGSELETTVIIYLKEKQLFARIKNNEQGQLKIEGIDKFMIEQTEIVFIRKNSTIIGFTVNAGRVKNLEFKKL